MRLLLSMLCLCFAATAAQADIAPSPERRNRPYLNALQQKGLACGSISGRDIVADAPEAKGENNRRYVYTVNCGNGARYRMVVEQLPRSGRRSRIDNIRLISARRM